MKPPAPTWFPCPSACLRAPALLLSFALAGCHSLPLGSLISSTDERAAVRFGQPTIARLGDPVPTASVIQQVSAQEPAPMPTASQVIDLPMALARAGVDNPTIAFAEEAVRVSLAEQRFARSLLFPTLDAGANYRLHRGNLLSGSGVITDVNTQSLYGGFGADVKGGGAVAVPGLRLVAHLADAVNAPQAARQRVVQTRFDAAATRNNILREVGFRYLALAEAHSRWAAYQQSLKEFAEIERLTTEFAKAKEGREADADRARSEKLLLMAQAQRMKEDIGVAAAALAQLLDLDPSLPLRPTDAVPPLLELVDTNILVQALLAQALNAHPEIVARNAEVTYQEIRLRQERVRPFLPLVAVGFSAGEFGGSPDGTSRLGSFRARTDLDIVAVWSLQNAGLGNRAVQNIARSEWEQAQFERARVIDRIRREVVEAKSLVETARQEMQLARSRVQTSQSAYALDLARVKNLVGGKNARAYPIEVLQSANQLAAARQDLVRAMTGYSQAQLQLYTALGN